MSTTTATLITKQKAETKNLPNQTQQKLAAMSTTVAPPLAKPRGKVLVKLQTKKKRTAVLRNNDQVRKSHALSQSDALKKGSATNVWTSSPQTPDGIRTTAGTNRPIQLREYVEPAVLDALIRHPDLAEYRKKLVSYRDTGQGGERIVTYAPTDHGIGRHYADKGLSMQSFPRKIRHTLAKTIDGTALYHDIDMANAHPTILSQLCQRKIGRAHV